MSKPRTEAGRELLAAHEPANRDGNWQVRRPDLRRAILAIEAERSAGPAPLDVLRLSFALCEHYGERKSDTCWHDHDAERVARIYERAVEYGYIAAKGATDG